MILNDNEFCCVILLLTFYALLYGLDVRANIFMCSKLCIYTGSIANIIFVGYGLRAYIKDQPLSLSVCRTTICWSLTWTKKRTSEVNAVPSFSINIPNEYFWLMSWLVGHFALQAVA